MAKRPWRASLAVSLLTLSLASFSAVAQEIPIVSGDQWTKSSSDAKKAYLIGIANLAHVEMAYFGSTPPSDAQSFIPRMRQGLRGETLDSVGKKLDAWYAANPTRLSRPVLDVMWGEIVVPGLKKP